MEVWFDSFEFIRQWPMIPDKPTRNMVLGEIYLVDGEVRLSKDWIKCLSKLDDLSQFVVLATSETPSTDTSLETPPKNLHVLRLNGRYVVKDANFINSKDLITIKKLTDSQVKSNVVITFDSVLDLDKMYYHMNLEPGKHQTYFEKEYEAHWTVWTHGKSHC